MYHLQWPAQISTPLESENMSTTEKTISQAIIEKFIELYKSLTFHYCLDRDPEYFRHPLRLFGYKKHHQITHVSDFVFSEVDYSDFFAKFAVHRLYLLKSGIESETPVSNGVAYDINIIHSSARIQENAVYSIFGSFALMSKFIVLEAWEELEKDSFSNCLTITCYKDGKLVITNDDERRKILSHMKRNKNLIKQNILQTLFNPTESKKLEINEP